MNAKWTALWLWSLVCVSVGVSEPDDGDTSVKQTYLAEAEALLAPTGTVAQSRLDRLTNTVLLVTWTPRSQLLKYNEQVQAYVAGQTDGWGIRPFRPTTFVMNSSGVVWWVTLSFPSMRRSWTASLDDQLAQEVFATFTARIPTNAIPEQLPDTSFRIEIVERSADRINGKSFHIPDLDTVEALLAKIKTDGKDERLTDWKDLGARPMLPWIRKNVMKTGEANKMPRHVP